MGLHGNLLHLHEEAHAVSALVEHLRSLNLLDDDNLAISIESQTSFKEIIESLLDEEAEADADVAKMAARIKELQARKKSYEARKEMIRSIIGVTMDQSKIPSIRTAFGTVSAKPVPAGLVIVSEPDIPVDYWKTSDPVLDRKKLLEDVKRCENARAEALALAKAAFAPEHDAIAAMPEGKDRELAEQTLAEVEKQTFARICEEYPVVPGATLGETTRTIAIRR